MSIFGKRKQMVAKKSEISFEEKHPLLAEISRKAAEFREEHGIRPAYIVANHENGVRIHMAIRMGLHLMDVPRWEGMSVLLDDDAEDGFTLISRKEALKKYNGRFYQNGTAIGCRII